MDPQEAQGLYPPGSIVYFLTIIQMLQIFGLIIVQCRCRSIIARSCVNHDRTEVRPPCGYTAGHTHGSSERCGELHRRRNAANHCGPALFCKRCRSGDPTKADKPPVTNSINNVYYLFSLLFLQCIMFFFDVLLCTRMDSALEKPLSHYLR
jgi:hypothetical protein